MPYGLEPRTSGPHAGLLLTRASLRGQALRRHSVHHHARLNLCIGPPPPGWVGLGLRSGPGPGPGLAVAVVAYARCELEPEAEVHHRAACVPVRWELSGAYGSRHVRSATGCLITEARARGPSQHRVSIEAAGGAALDPLCESGADMCPPLEGQLAEGRATLFRTQERAARG